MDNALYVGLSRQMTLRRQLDIVANNICGPIVDRTAPASGAILGSSGVSSLGSTDANANFSH